MFALNRYTYDYYEYCDTLVVSDSEEKLVTYHNAMAENDKYEYDLIEWGEHRSYARTSKGHYIIEEIEVV